MVPASYDEAHAHHRDMWKVAMDDELQSRHEIRAKVLAPREDDIQEVVKSSWEYPVKEGENTDEPRYKRRFLAKGFTEEQLADFFEPFPRVISSAYGRCLLLRMDTTCHSWI